jgi:methionine-rich copper-binding protein CopC
MSFRPLPFLATSVLAIGASLLAVSAAFAHATINQLNWDDPSAPAVLTATSGGDKISAEPGTFYLRVYNVDGGRVDNNDAAVSASNEYQMSVSVRPGLPPGEYRVEWQTASADDGDSAHGSLTIQVLAAGAAPAMDHSQGDTAEMDHDHADTAGMGHDQAAAVTTSHEEDSTLAEAISDACHHLRTPETWEVQLLGANQVPEPVDSPVSGIARLTYDPVSHELTYAITVSGASPNLITAAHLHYGGPDETGPHAFDFINEGFTQVSGSTTLEHDVYHALCEGELYINLHSVAHPAGAARAQVQIPSIAAAVVNGTLGGHIKPPATGDAGLAAAHEAKNVSPLIPALALLAVAGAAAGTIGWARRRA